VEKAPLVHLPVRKYHLDADPLAENERLPRLRCSKYLQYSCAARSSGVVFSFGLAAIWSPSYEDMYLEPSEVRGWAIPFAVYIARDMIVVVGETIVVGAFEWDADKAEANSIKRGVTFEQGMVALADVQAIVDADDSTGETRLEVIGGAYNRTLFVVAVERGELDRIISARRATPTEAKRYKEEPRCAQ
jgi:uncharacterized protein